MRLLALACGVWNVRNRQWSRILTRVAQPGVVIIRICEVSSASVVAKAMARAACLVRLLEAIAPLDLILVVWLGLSE